jgi:hypothetical protein
MTSPLEYFEGLSSRARKAHELLFAEYASIRKIQSTAVDPELGILFRAIIVHEQNFLKQDFPLLGRQSLPKDYVEQWRSAFLETIEIYAAKATDYSGVIEIFETFRRSLNDKTRSALPNLQKLLENPDTRLSDFLKGLLDAGFDAHLLGQMEAHWQARRLTQLFFGRYSAELRHSGIIKQARPRGSNNPRPDFQLYRRRQNMRAVLMGQPESEPGQFPIDNTVWLVLYLDHVNERCYFPSWFNFTRSLYTQKILLMPGLPGVDNFLEYIQKRHGDLASGLKRLRKEANRKTGGLKTESDDVDNVLVHIRAEHDVVAARVTPTLCLMNAVNGASYAGEFPGRRRWHPSAFLPVLFLDILPDAYAPDEINFDWNSILTDWKAAAASTAEKRPTLKKTKAQKHAERIAAFNRKITVIRARLAVAENALSLSDERWEKYLRKQDIKEHKAALRKAETAKRKAEKEEQRRLEKEKALSAAEKARRTIIKNRQIQLKKAAARKRKREEAKQETFTPQRTHTAKVPAQTKAERQRERMEREHAERQREKDIRKAERAFRVRHNLRLNKPEP